MDIQDLKEKFLSFDGRLNREPYILRNIAIGVVSALFGFVVEMSGSAILMVLGLVVSLFLTVCGVSLMVRRLHDLDKSGYFLLIMLIPVINIFFGLYMICFKGTEGYNRFGEDPLQ